MTSKYFKIYRLSFPFFKIRWPFIWIIFNLLIANWYFVSLFSLFCNCYHLFLEKGLASHLKKKIFFNHKKCFCKMWLKLVQVFNDENNGRQRTKISIRNAHLSLKLRWAKKAKKFLFFRNEIQLKIVFKKTYRPEYQRLLAVWSLSESYVPSSNKQELTITNKGCIITP